MLLQYGIPEYGKSRTARFDRMYKKIHLVIFSLILNCVPLSLAHAEEPDPVPQIKLLLYRGGDIEENAYSM
jgi:hypothetical protein